MDGKIIPIAILKNKLSIIIFSDSTIQVVDKDTKSIMNFNSHKSPILSVKLDPLSEFLVNKFISAYYLLFIESKTRYV